jgi:hypothetical protein
MEQKIILRMYKEMKEITKHSDLRYDDDAVREVLNVVLDGLCELHPKYKPLIRDALR